MRIFAVMELSTSWISGKGSRQGHCRRQRLRTRSFSILTTSHRNKSCSPSRNNSPSVPTPCRAPSRANAHSATAGYPPGSEDDGIGQGDEHHSDSKLKFIAANAQSMKCRQLAANLHSRNADVFLLSEFGRPTPSERVWTLELL
ncbi:BQ2448_469 [Microbotryum intermedium]|uniref:BQ2448_469 protein n=1 Tax=Microbotryum intermedium TaxID=269621 RepID=A0A238FB37_9BASI|nr:BQ2448_469 [Microbotryum intermedium]